MEFHPKASLKAPAAAKKARRTLGVSAVVVTFWTGDILFECLDSLLGHRKITEIIVINNGNPQTTIKRLHEMNETNQRLSLFEAGRNIGFAAGCNLGAAKAKGDDIAFVNPDCVVPPGTFAKVQKVFKKHKDAWLCGGRLENPDGTEQRGGRREVLTPWRSLVELLRLDKLFPNHPHFRRFHLFEEQPIEEACPVPTVSGAFMVVHKWAYDRVGGMDDNLFLHLDDSDLCIRIEQHGGKVYYCGHIPVTHYLSTSDVSKTFIDWHKTRSSTYYFHKHFLASYPSWFLLMMSVLLWTRFFVLMPVNMVVDLPGFFRRLQQR